MTTGTNLYDDIRQDIKKLLHERVLTVLFTKKDGTKRAMLCTLLPEHLPAVDKQHGDEAKPAKKQSKESIAVWDVESKAWRSFRVDSIVSYMPVSASVK